MCRMIAAIGRFSTGKILDAAISMSKGELADHDHPIRQHADAWGAIWVSNAEPRGCSVHRSLRMIADELDDFSLKTSGTRFLALHLRKATIPAQQGLEFAHPISRYKGCTQWHMMHNGCLPTIHRELGLKCSMFDSAEYFDYIVPGVGYSLDRHLVLKKLERLGPENTSANAFLVNLARFYVVHWYPVRSPHPRFYTMYTAYLQGAVIVSSEVVASLAPAHLWKPLPRVGLLEFILPSSI